MINLIIIFDDMCIHTVVFLMDKLNAHFYVVKGSITELRDQNE